MSAKEQNLVKIIKNFNLDYLDSLNLFYGKENFIKKQAVEKIKESKKTGFHFFWGDEVNLHQIKDVFSSSGLFSKGEVAVVWDVDQLFSKFSKKQVEDFLKFLDEIPQTDKLVLVSLKDKIPKKEPYKTILSKAKVFTAPPLTSKAFMISIKKKIEKEGLKIDDDTLLYLISKLGNDLYSAKQEVEKLITLTKNKEVIQKDDIDKIVFSKIEENVFSFVDKFFKKDKQAINIFKKLVEVSHHPFEIQALLLTYINRLLLLKTMERQGIPYEQIFQKIKVNHPFMQSNLKKLSQYLDENQLINLISSLYELEIKEKVYYEDPIRSFEEFLLRWLTLTNQ